MHIDGKKAGLLSCIMITSGYGGKKFHAGGSPLFQPSSYIRLSSSTQDASISAVKSNWARSPRTVLGVVLLALRDQFADGKAARTAALEFAIFGQQFQTFDATRSATAGTAAIPVEKGERGPGLSGRFGEDDFLKI